MEQEECLLRDFGQANSINFEIPAEADFIDIPLIHENKFELGV